MSRVCAKCKKERPLSEFYESCSSYCKECKRIIQRTYYAPKKKETKERRLAIYRDGLKRCNTCGEYKPTDEYSHKPDNWDNLNHKCRACANEEGRGRVRRRRKRDKEKMRQQRRQWYLANRETKLQKNAEWRRKNKAASHAIWHRYKGRKLNADGDFTDEQWESLMWFYAPDGKCLCCGKKENLTIDHVVPLNLGGANHAGNLQPLCKPCNSGKGGYRSEDYRFDGGEFAWMVAWGMAI